MAQSKETNIIEYTADDGTNLKLTPSIVQNYIVGNKAKITDQEFVLFAALCKARKLNPLTKEAYLIKYGDQPAQLVVSKDAILKRAIKHPMFNGKESGIITKNQDGIYTERQGCFCPSDEKLEGGWCRVYRKDREYPEYMSVSLNEVAQKTKDGKMNNFWTTKTATMLEKVAKVRALREAFVDELAGMYEADEMEKEPVEEKANDPMDVIDVETKEVNIDEI